MKRRPIIFALLFLFFMLPLNGLTIAAAEKGTIKLTLISKTDTTGGVKKRPVTIITL